MLISRKERNCQFIVLTESVLLTIAVQLNTEYFANISGVLARKVSEIIFNAFYFV